jgi:hypothetical protein
MLTSFKGFEFYPLGSAKLTDNTSNLLVSDIDNSSLSGFGVYAKGKEEIVVSFEPFDLTEETVIGTRLQIRDGKQRVKTIMESSIAPYNTEEKQMGYYVNGKMLTGQVFVRAFKNGEEVAVWEIPLQTDSETNFFLAFFIAAIVGALAYVIIKSIDAKKRVTETIIGPDWKAIKIETETSFDPSQVSLAYAPSNAIIYKGSNVVEFDHIYVSNILYVEGDIPSDLKGDIQNVEVNIKGTNQAKITNVTYS